MKGRSYTYMVEKKPKDVIVVQTDRPTLIDLNGNDALLLSSPELRTQVQRAAIATMPVVYTRTLHIIRTSKNEKCVLEAMKFMKDLSEGEISAKNIDAAVRSMTDEEILSKLEGKFDQDDE